MAKAHTFHIPVMGIGFTIDTPLKVSKYGIDSVLSLVDDILLEKLRKMYCTKFEIPYQEITDKIEDFRAKRITSYLNLLNDLAEKKFEELKSSASGVKEYFNLLPDTSTLKQEFKKLTEKSFNFNEISAWVKDNLPMGSIDVNIMTKIDGDNYKDGEKLPIEYNDAHAALRGFAESNLKSSIVLSAGMNPRLYTYMENFKDFYPDENNELKKKIILKVSDFRSALIQAKFLAKKGLWVSEYRIESGLNCGGHAFATDGFLLGPILNEVKENKQYLIDNVDIIYKEGLKAKDKNVPSEVLPIKITIQGGVGTAEEHEFLLNHYNMDMVGWGSPFLLVPEVVNVDDETSDLLSIAKEKDLYLSDISPLGVKFNSLKGNTKDAEKLKLAAEGKPGSLCPKKYLVSNKEYTDKAICTASFRFQRLKIKELNEKNLDETKYKKEYDKIIDKSCICVGLGTSALINYGLDTKVEGLGVSICPGPNMAYYSKKRTLKEMVDNIYGRTNTFNHSNRPNMFIKELDLYIDYMKTKIEDAKESYTAAQGKYLIKFGKNLEDGINYYNSLFNNLKGAFEDKKDKMISDLNNSKEVLNNLIAEVKGLTEVVA